MKIRKILSLVLALLILLQVVPAPSRAHAEDGLAEEETSIGEEKNSLDDDDSNKEDKSQEASETPPSQTEDETEKENNKSDGKEDKSEVNSGNLEINLPLDSYQVKSSSKVVDPSGGAKPIPSIISKGELDADHNPLTHPAEDGEVMVYKSAKRVPGLVNTWDVTLRLEEKEKAKSVDIALVIDNSRSMGKIVSGGEMRIDKARESAKSFAKNLLDDKEIDARVGYIRFSTGKGTYSTSKYKKNSSYYWYPKVPHYYKLDGNPDFTDVDDDAHVEHNLTDDYKSLEERLDDIKILGGTNTQAGLHKGRLMLEDSQADYKYIVLITDGRPTASYAFNYGVTSRPGFFQTPPEGPIEIVFAEEDLSDKPRQLYDISTDRISYFYEAPYYIKEATITSVSPRNLVEDDFNYYRGYGIGTSRFLKTSQSVIKTYPKRYPSSIYLDHMISYASNAISEAGIARNQEVSKGNHIQVMTIGVDISDTASPILDMISDDNLSFFTSSENLSDKLAEVKDKIKSNQIKDFLVEDVLAEGIVLDSFEDGSQFKTTDPSDEVSIEGNKITWKADKLKRYKEMPKAGSDKVDTIYGDQITFRVRINENIHKQEKTVLENAPDYLYDTNEEAKVTFTNVSGAEYQGFFPKPKVDPVFYDIEKVVEDENGNVIKDFPEGKTFTVDISGKLTGSIGLEPNTIYSEYLGHWGPLHTLYKEGEHVFQESLSPEDASDYDVKYEVYFRDPKTDSYVRDDSYDYTSQVRINVSKESDVFTYDEDKDCAERVDQVSANGSHRDFKILVRNIEKPGRITIEKLWFASNGKTRIYPKGETAEIKIYRSSADSEKELYRVDGKESISLTGNESNEWTKELVLPRRDSQGNYYTYYIEEVKPEGYEEISDPEKKKFTFSEDYSNFKDAPVLQVANKSTNDRSIKIVKKWAPKAPEGLEEIKVNLYRGIDPKNVDEKVGNTIVLSKANDWQCVLKGLDMTDPDGNEYIYRVEEEDIVNGYYASYEKPKIEGDQIVLVLKNTEITMPATGIGHGIGSFIGFGLLVTLAGIFLMLKKKKFNLS